MEDVTRLSRRCPRCGKALPDDAPEALCPACLLAAATETLTQATLDDALTVAVRGAATTHAELPRLTDGASWGPYRIGRLLGRGGMGEVHEAEHLESGRRIALKVLRDRLQDADERARFLREGQLAASISHPHTVYIFGSEEIAGVPVIAMELLPGGTLKDRVAAEGPLPPAVAVSAVLDIIGGLDAAQAAGILHRDIKPSNCFVDSDGSVKVGDFGLSISTLARDVHEQLATGFEGTPQFAAPEQLRGEPLDLRADIYAVGATLYYLLTGQPPFDARDLRELFARVNAEPPKSPRALRPDIPSGLATVILRCLSKSPAQRPESYPALAEQLRPFSAIGEAPAPLHLRVLASTIDVLILSVPFTIWDAATAPLVINGQRPASAGTWTWVLYAIYFFVLEARWNASLGKRLLGLQLTSVGGAGWAMRVARRTIVFHLPWLVFALAVVWFGPIGPLRDIRLSENSRLDAEQMRGLIHSVVTLTLMAALFLTARRHNGWAGLHDLVSGIRVVSRAPARLGTRSTANATPAVDAPLTAARGARYGPFIASADVRDTDADLIVGFDPVLRRKVWIQVVSPDTPHVSAVRRDLSRTGRLHWLTGRRNGTDNWDAFEAPDGQPLLRARQASPPAWSTLKSWLLDLSAELLAAERDGSTPALRLDRLWIRSDGRLVLLDFPAPGLVRADAATTDLSPVQLLSAVAGLSTLMSRDDQPLMPLSARMLLRSWSQEHSLSLADTHAELERIAALPDRVRRARRALPIALAAMPMVTIVGITALVLVPALRLFFGPETGEMRDLLGMLARPTPSADSRLADPEVRRAMEIYLAGQHGALLRNSVLWNSPAMENAGDIRRIAEAIVATHPSVTRESLAQATTTIAPELEGQRQRRGGDAADPAGNVVLMNAAVSLLPGLLLGIISSLIVPGGLLTRMLGHAVVTRSGNEIGRLLSLLRVLVAWAPAIAWLLYLAASPRAMGFVPTPPHPIIGIAITFAALGIGAIVTIARPSRGPHDWLLGTTVVPR